MFVRASNPTAVYRELGERIRSTCPGVQHPETMRTGCGSGGGGTGKDCKSADWVGWVAAGALCLKLIGTSKLKNRDPIRTQLFMK